MKWMKWFAVAVALAGCKAQLKDPLAEGMSCPMQRSTVPQEFITAVAEVAGAVQMETCEVIAVGVTASHEVLIAKYDRSGVRVREFASGGFYRPLAGHVLSGYEMHMQRLEILPSGIYAFGWYSSAGSGDIVVMKIKSDGVLAFDFGPKRDGVIYGEFMNQQSVRIIDVPKMIDDRYFSLLVTYNSMTTGAQYTRAVRLSVDGRDTLPVQKVNAPNGCEIVNHSGIYEGMSFQIRQGDCASMQWAVQGRGGINDNLRVFTDGTVYNSAAVGEFSVHYDPSGQWVMSSLDTLGNVKSEYMIFVGGRRNMCGKPVDPSQRYLVFSRKLPHEAEFLANCWFF